MITDTQFNQWLKNSAAMRCVLVEADVKPAAGGSVVTRYLSSRGYVTGSGDTPANTSYTARVTGGIKFTRSLTLDGTTSLSFGDIQLMNADGLLDTWLDDYWVNRKVVVLVGDVTWARSDFRVMYTGTLTGIDTSDRTKVNLKMSDILQRLNNPVTEVKIGGSSARADDLMPLCFGECHNVTPVLIDSTVNEYMVHNGTIEDIIEVRDNGIPVSITKFLTTGKFRLTNAPAGTITASVQGAKIVKLSGGAAAYTNNIADIVHCLMTVYGNATIKLADVDIDTATMVQFGTDNPQPVGIYLSDRQNVLDVCNQLVASVGGRIYTNTAGLASVVKLSLPWAGATTAVAEGDIADRTIAVKQMVDVVASVQIGYCKNWTVQDGLTTGIIPEHVALFSEEWLTMTATDSTAAANYNLFTDPTMVETNLEVTSDALAEANRRLNIFNTQRKVVKFTGMPQLLFLGLGSYVTLTNRRFGLASGKVGQVTSVAVDPMSPQIEFEVLV